MTVIPASCPQCGAQYQLTPEHLVIANGKVRCGVCNTVFQAVTPGSIPVPTPQAPQTAPLRQNPAAPKSQFVNEDDDLLLDNDLIDDAPSERHSIKTSEFSNEFANFSDDNHNDFGVNDEVDTLSKKGRTGGLAGTSAELEDADEDEWVSKLLAEEGLDADEVIKKPDPVSKPVKEGPRKALGSSMDDFDFDLDGLDGAPLALSQEEQAAYGFGEDDTKEEMIRNIKPEPLVLQILHKTSLMTNIGMGILGLIAVCGIALQLFFFQKDTLSRDPEWRQFYESTCGMLGCDLPAQYAINDIQATNLTIKSHPHYRQSLMVDAIIINRAGFPQPFPNIELYFTDTAQNVIAARQFKPAEYLRGELTDASLMPSQQSIHIALEINDPGENASGYYVNLNY